MGAQRGRETDSARKELKGEGAQAQCHLWSGALGRGRGIRGLGGADKAAQALGDGAGVFNAGFAHSAEVFGSLADLYGQAGADLAEEVGGEALASGEE